MDNQKTRIKSVSKALQVLDLLGKNPNGLLVKEISITLKLNLSTTYHLINTLLDAGYVNKLKDDVFMLGYQIPFLHNAFIHSMASHTLLNTYLQELSDTTQETAYLGREVDDEVVLMGIIDCPQAIKVKTLYIGYREYPHARALPKSIIAYWPDKKVKEYFKDKTFDKLTEFTPSSLEELLLELKVIRENGYCVEEEGFTKGICCIAVPVFDASKKPIAAYSVTMPSERYKQHKEEYIEKVCKIALNASRCFGYYENDAVGFK
ncbi:IclR family transcriptional regulator [Ammoniphilus sp. YIM 78166]|uniref:IclR family transcriptional regulator n=1 Tax=Ammoniphilus sp. YIM 78166 TaxID=1644106 RepID=UPI00142FA14E|nr:IclR family transcriptional regulator [Ammoniphilus sp. YIM 78166]